jgi:hypothetical protein
LDDTGLYFYNARYYDATIGRFISPDPITHSEPLPQGQIIKDLTVYHTTTQFYTPDTRFPTHINPQEHNRYSYALNNPLRYTDPDGHQAEAAFAVAGSSVWIPGWGWIVAVSAVTVGGAIILEEETGCLSSAWNAVSDAVTSAAGAIGGFFSNLNPFKNDDKNNNKEKRSLRERIKDANENPDKWEKIDQRPDPNQPKNGSSVRELWRNKETGELLEKHVLERNGEIPKNHPHWEEPEGW